MAIIDMVQLSPRMNMTTRSNQIFNLTYDSIFTLQYLDYRNIQEMLALIFREEVDLE